MTRFTACLCVALWLGSTAGAQSDDPGIEPPPELQQGDQPAEGGSPQVKPPAPADSPAADSTAPAGAAEQDGFPEPVEIAQRPTPELDGDVFTVSRFTMEYDRPHPNHPSIEQFFDLEIPLVRTPSGWITPDSGLPFEYVTLRELGSHPEQRYYASAINAIMVAVQNAYRDAESLIGVYVVTDPAQFGDPRSPADRREPGDTTLNIQVYTARVTSLKTIASGDRFPESDRINNPAHDKIRERSPLQPATGENGGGMDLLRRDLLDDYALKVSRHPGRRVDVALARDSGESGSAELQFLVQEAKPWTAYFQLSNTGTENTDEIRQRFGFIHNQLFGKDDIFSIEYVTANFDESHAVIGSYERPLWGSERMRYRLTGSWNEYTASDVGILGEQFEGEGWSYGGELIWNLTQKGPFFLDIVGGFRYQHIEILNTTLGFSTNAEDDLLLPYVGLRAERYTEVSSFSGAVSLEWSLSDISGANQNSLEPLGRQDPDEDWEVLKWDFGWSLFLEPALNRAAWEDPTTWRSSTLAHEIAVSFRGQYAFQNRFIPNAQYVIGGLYSVRGYPESAVAGDTVLVGSVEYRFHVPRAFEPNSEPIEEIFGLPLRRPFRVAPQQVYGRPDWDLVLKGFFDFGQSYNSNRDELVERNESLMSAGFGAEVQIRRNVSFRTDWGWVLDEIGNGSTEVGSNRFHFVLTVLF